MTQGVSRSQLARRQLDQHSLITLDIACDCLSIAPDWFGTQATVLSVTDSIPATFLNSAAYRLTDPSPDMVSGA